MPEPENTVAIPDRTIEILMCIRRGIEGDGDDFKLYKFRVIPDEQLVFKLKAIAIPN